MKNEERLYDLAFRYKKEEPWEHIFEEDVFAIESDDGQLSYVSVMGSMQEQFILSVYLDRLQSLFNIKDFEVDPEDMQYPHLLEAFLAQDSIQFALEPKAELSPEEQQSVRQYAKAHGIKLSGKNAYPRFQRLRPYRMPQPITDPADEIKLMDAIEATLEVRRIQDEDGPRGKRLDFYMSVLGEKGLIPLFKRVDGVMTLVGKTDAPLPEEPVYPEGEITDIALLKKLKESRKIPGKTLLCGVTWMPTAISDEDPPYYPPLLIAVSAETGKVYLPSIVKHYEEDYNELLTTFAHDILLKERPETLLVDDDRTYTLLEKASEAVGIELDYGDDEEMEPLLEAELSIIDPERDNPFNEEGLDQDELMHVMLEELDKAPAHHLQDMPDVLLAPLRELYDSNALTGQDKEMLDRIFEKIQGGNPAQKAAVPKGKPAIRSISGGKLSYVISVSLQTGCYRHIQISADMTLYDLHSAIISEFGFTDDHAHAFFMDNQAWSDWDSYYSDMIEDCERPTSDYTLRQAGLSEGMKFVYVFDFGEDWRFHCRVLREVPEDTDEPIVVRSKGTPPSQYSW